MSIGKAIGKNVSRTGIVRQKIVALVPNVSTTIAIANTNRFFISATLNCSVIPPVCVFIKLQSASIDNDLVGEILFRNFLGNDNANQMRWYMPESNEGVYDGEVSAITSSTGIDLYITEF